MPAFIRLKPVEERRAPTPGMGCFVVMCVVGLVLMGIGMAILAAMGHPQ